MSSSLSESWNNVSTERLPAPSFRAPMTPQHHKHPVLVQKLSHGLSSPRGGVLAHSCWEVPTWGTGAPKAPLPPLVPLSRLHPPAPPHQRPALSQEPPSLPGSSLQPASLRAILPGTLLLSQPGELPKTPHPMLCMPCPFLSCPGAHTRLSQARSHPAQQAAELSMFVETPEM